MAQFIDPLIAALTEETEMQSNLRKMYDMLTPENFAEGGVGRDEFNNRLCILDALAVVQGKAPLWQRSHPTNEELDLIYESPEANLLNWIVDNRRNEYRSPNGFHAKAYGYSDGGVPVEDVHRLIAAGYVLAGDLAQQLRFI
jgi:hypothetical protein